MILGNKPSFVTATYKEDLSIDEEIFKKVGLCLKWLVKTLS
jgi:hypothetical protein